MKIKAVLFTNHLNNISSKRFSKQVDERLLCLVKCCCDQVRYSLFGSLFYLMIGSYSSLLQQRSSLEVRHK